MPEEPAESARHPAEPADCSQTHEETRSRNELAQRAPICHLQQVRGSGEAEVLRLAATQYGHVHRSQLVHSGIGLLIASHNVLRVTGHQIDRRPYALIARIARMTTALRLNAA
jgi:hypothetical protein